MRKIFITLALWFGIILIIYGFYQGWLTYSQIDAKVNEIPFGYLWKQYAPQARDQVYFLVPFMHFIVYAIPGLIIFLLAFYFSKKTKV